MGIGLSKKGKMFGQSAGVMVPSDGVAKNARGQHSEKNAAPQEDVHIEVQIRFHFRLRQVRPGREFLHKELSIQAPWEYMPTES